MTPKPFLQSDVSAFDWFLSDVADHYERTSPVVIIWLDAVADSLVVGQFGFPQGSGTQGRR
jgi:hypothetical protein